MPAPLYRGMDQFEKGKPEPGTARYEQLMKKLVASQAKLEALQQEQDALMFLQRQAAQANGSQDPQQQMDLIQRRLQAVNQMYQSQEEKEAEEEDDSPEAVAQQLEGKLAELSEKKEHMNQLLQELAQLRQKVQPATPPIRAERGNKVPSAAEVNGFQAKVQEIQQMKARLATLQGLMMNNEHEALRRQDSSHRREHNDLRNARRREDTEHNDLRGAARGLDDLRVGTPSRRHEDSHSEHNDLRGFKRQDDVHSDFSEESSECINKMNKLVEYRTKLAKMQELVAAVESTQSAGLHMDALPQQYQNMIHMFANEEARSEASSIEVDKEVKELPSKRGRQPKNARPQINLWQEEQQAKSDDVLTADEGDALQVYNDAVLRQQLMLTELQKKKEELTSLLGSMKQQTKDLDYLRQTAIAVENNAPLQNGYSSEEADVVEEPETGERDNHGATSPNRGPRRQPRPHCAPNVGEVRSQSLGPRDPPSMRQQQEGAVGHSYEPTEERIPEEMYGDKMSNSWHDFLPGMEPGRSVDTSGLAIQQSLMGLSHCFQMLYIQQRELQSLKEQVHRLTMEGGGSRETLNNQVMPGMRANNYWDNFRSYSCQNLLSKPRAQTVPPSEGSRIPRPEVNKNDRKQLNQRVNVDLGARPKEGMNRRQREQLNEPTTRRSAPAAPASSGMREAVYAEVAQLIAVNENRPQFLMDLFRELQELDSDSLRTDALRLIQRLQHKHSSPAGVNEMTATDASKPCGVENLQLGAIPKIPPSPARQSSEEAAARSLDTERDPVMHVFGRPNMQGASNDGEDGDSSSVDTTHSQAASSHDQPTRPPRQQPTHKPFSMFGSSGSQSSSDLHGNFVVPKVMVMPIQMKQAEEEAAIDLADAPESCNLELAEADQSPGSADQGDGIQPEAHMRMPGILNDSSWLEDGVPQNRHDQSGDLEAEMGLDEVPTRLDGPPDGGDM